MFVVVNVVAVCYNAHCSLIYMVNINFHVLKVNFHTCSRSGGFEALGRWFGLLPYQKCTCAAMDDSCHVCREKWTWDDGLTSLYTEWPLYEPTMNPGAIMQPTEWSAYDHLGQKLKFICKRPVRECLA